MAGILLAVASGATYALATMLGRPLTTVAGPLMLTTVTFSAGALGLLPLALLASGPHVSRDPYVMGLLGYLGVATLLEPLTAAVLAAVVLDERLGVLGVVGLP